MIKKEPVRCTECRHKQMCSQTVSMYDIQYHIYYCSLGEKEESKEKKDESN